MHTMKPKEQHERLLANVDKKKIVQSLNDGQDQDITRIAVILARQCDLFDHFQRLWQMRVSDLDAKLSTQQYMKNVYVNKRALYKELIRPATPQAKPATPA
jgi:hypothetical protein